MSGFQSPNYGGIKSLFGVCSGVELRERVTTFLRKRYPVKAAENVAADTSLPIGTVQKWFSRETCPSGPAVILLIFVYGPNLLAAIMKDPPEWIDKAASEADIALFDHQIAQLEAAKEARR